jgi:ParB family chromosome partitioning protein
MSKFGSLLGDVAFQLDAGTNALAVTKIPLARVKPDPRNPRKKFDQAQLEELAESIKERGLLQPITVRAEPSGTTFVIRYGERRWRASGIAGLTEIDAIVTESKADENDLLDQVIENDQRADLSASEIGRAVAEALNDGIKANDIAKRLGRPKSVIAEYAALKEMPPFLQELADTVPIGTLYPLFLAWRANGAQVEAFVSEKAGRAITRSEARALSREASGKEPPEQKSDDGSEPPLPFAGDGNSSAGRTFEGSGAAPGAPAENGKDAENSAGPAAPAPAIPPPAATKPPAPTPASGQQSQAAPTAKAAPAAPAKPATPPAAPEPEIAVMIDRRRAWLKLPATVEVVFEDDGSSASVDRASVSVAEE